MISRMIPAEVKHLGYKDLDYNTKILVTSREDKLVICNPEAKLTYRLPLEEVIKLIKEENNNHV